MTARVSKIQQLLVRIILTRMWYIDKAEFTLCDFSNVVLHVVVRTVAEHKITGDSLGHELS